MQTTVPVRDPAALVAGAPELTVVVPCYNERPNVAVLVQRLHAALAGVRWQVVFVDDNSPDGTADAVRALAQGDGRVQCIRRVGRRGLASAVIEGALASSATYVGVIDGDLQHDETRLVDMLALLRAGACDVALASRYLAAGDAAGLGGGRRRLSALGIRLAQAFLPARLSDPMSGFFMVRRDVFEAAAPKLTGQGFKILLDLLLSEPGLRLREIPAAFHERAAGQSKLDALVLAQFGALLLDKALGGVVPLRFLGFATVGAVGVVVNVAVLLALRRLTGLSFEASQILATLAAMAANFQLNNRITYRDQMRRGRRFWSGLVLFMLGCGIGAIADVGIASALFRSRIGGGLAAAAGALIGVVWNYSISSTLVWRRR